MLYLKSLQVCIEILSIFAYIPSHVEVFKNYMFPVILSQVTYMRKITH